MANNPHAGPGIDLTVTVLTTGFWPSYKSFDLNLPAEMVSICRFLVVIESVSISDMSCAYFRLNVLKFSGNSIKQRPNIESLHGYTHWELATSLASLNLKLWS